MLLGMDSVIYFALAFFPEKSTCRWMPPLKFLFYWHCSLAWTCIPLIPEFKTLNPVHPLASLQPRPYSWAPSRKKTCFEIKMSTKLTWVCFWIRLKTLGDTKKQTVVTLSSLFLEQLLYSPSPLQKPEQQQQQIWYLQTCHNTKLTKNRVTFSKGPKTERSSCLKQIK